MSTKSIRIIAVLAVWLIAVPAQAVKGKGGLNPPPIRSALRFEITKLDVATVGIQWASRFNWVKILTREDDPIVAAVRMKDERFLNTLVLDAAVRLDLIEKFIEDAESQLGGTQVTIVNGTELPLVRGRTRPAAPSLGAFPASGGSDASVDHALETMLDVIASCQGGSGSPIADGDGQCFDSTSGSCHAGGEGKSSQGGWRPPGTPTQGQLDQFNAIKDEPAGDPFGGGRGNAWALMIRSVIDLLVRSGEQPPDETGTSEEGHDDAEGCEGSEEECSEEAPPPSSSPAPQPTPAPGSGDASGGAPAPAPSPSPNGGSPGDAGMPSEDSTCDTAAVAAAMVVELCDAADWQTYDCQKTVRAANGCADTRLINPAPDGESTCNGEGMTDAELDAFECRRRGMIAQPGEEGTTCKPSRTKVGILPPSTVDLCHDPRALVDAETCATLSAGVGGGPSAPGSGSGPGVGQPGPGQPGLGNPAGKDTPKRK